MYLQPQQNWQYYFGKYIAKEKQNPTDIFCHDPVLWFAFPLYKLAVYVVDFTWWNVFFTSNEQEEEWGQAHM